MVAVAKQYGRPLSKGADVGRRKTAKDLSTLTGRIGHAVYLRRVEAGLSIEQFHAKLARHGCKVSEATIYAWEGGSRPIPVNELPAIAKALRAKLHDLIPA